MCKHNQKVPGIPGPLHVFKPTCMVFTINLLSFCQDKGEKISFQKIVVYVLTIMNITKEHTGF